jgi:outer membrane protein OmpA-like peptidoglycan-associated protein
MKKIAAAALSLIAVMSLVHGADIEGASDHPMVSRYPGMDLSWQEIENYRPFRVPFGPVVGYRTIGDWIDTEGRVTRSYYSYQGTERGYAEVYKNYLDGLKSAGFEILAENLSIDRKGAAIGTSQWSLVYFAANPWNKHGAVDAFMHGVSSQGGAGAIVASKDRAAGKAFVVINVEQDSAEKIGVLVDIVEVEAAETGLVAINPEAIGKDIDEYGRVVLTGLVFDYDKASIRPESEETLAAIAQYLEANPAKSFYVVGHTDSKGTFSYNRKLSADRAEAVISALVSRFSVDRKRVEPHGVGPLSPVFANSTDAGREQNRRVELVERQPEQ